MGGTGDEMKGRAKEAIGDLTDDQRLRQEGRQDRTAGRLKQKVNDAKNWVEDKIDRVRGSSGR